MGVEYHHTEEKPVEASLGVLTDRLSEVRTRTNMIGYPVRCKACNGRYQAHKRAREAGMRMEFIRKAQKGNKFTHLKFVTLTWPREWTEDAEPDLKTFKKKFKAARDSVSESIGALGGTDVIEVITKQREDGLYAHHIHTHGLWVAPFVPMDELRAAFVEAGVGRFEYTVLRERVWKMESGEVRTKQAIWCAIDYLAKYLTKCQGQKRQVWGALRKWKEYLPKRVCSSCVKTTRQVQDYQNCDCHLSA